MPTKSRPDPVLVGARREACMVLVMWLMAGGYTLLYCLRHGYNRDLADLTFTWGFPDWVFWGIVVPWGCCVVASGLFAFCFMRDDPLGEDAGAQEHESNLPSSPTERPLDHA